MDIPLEPSSDPEPLPAPPAQSVQSSAHPSKRRRRLVASLMIAAMAVGGVAGYSITRTLQSAATSASTTSVGADAGSGTASTGTKLTLAQIESTVGSGSV